MLPTLARRAAHKVARPQLEYIQRIRELYPPKKVWPPDFSRLSPQEQLRYEKKYKRRMALATTRPKWDKAVKLLQLFSVVSVIIYTILFMDWKTTHQPFDEIRQTFWGFLGFEYESSSAKSVPKRPSQDSPQVK